MAPRRRVEEQSVSETKPITVTSGVLLALHAPTPESARKTRRGPLGKDLTYVDARYVMQVLDSELGPGNWQDDYAMSPSGKVSCRIGVYVEDRGWVWKGDGAGETDIEGEKGSFSDAFKRAAVKWGIARDLYSEKPVATAPAQPAAAQPKPEAAAPAADGDGGVCPVHGWEWRVQPGGTTKAGKDYDAFYKCGGKDASGQYCRQKPSAGWVEAHPIAG
jgi:hypothetical protein